MKYMKRAKIYQCSNYNCTFDPAKVEAFSYKWWKFVAIVEGKVVFNNYRYSVTTAKHQSKVRALMNELGIKIDYEMSIPEGIKPASLEELIERAEVYLCNSFLAKALRNQERYQEKKAAKDAEFKRNLDSLTHEDVEKFRAAKLAIVGGAQ